MEDNKNIDDRDEGEVGVSGYLPDGTNEPIMATKNDEKIVRSLNAFFASARSQHMF